MQGSKIAPSLVLTGWAKPSTNRNSCCRPGLFLQLKILQNCQTSTVVAVCLLVLISFHTAYCLCSDLGRDGHSHSVKCFFETTRMRRDCC